MSRRNSDERLRELYRLWRSTRDDQDLGRWIAELARVVGGDPWEVGLTRKRHDRPRDARGRLWEASIRADEEPVRTAFFGFNGIDFRGELEANTSPAAYALAFEIIANSEAGAQYGPEFLMVTHPDDCKIDPGKPTFQVVLRDGRVLQTAWRPTEDVDAAREEALADSRRSAAFLGISPMTADDWRPWNPANYSSIGMAATDISVALGLGMARNPETSPDDIKTVCSGCGKHIKGSPDAKFVSHGACSTACWMRAAEEAERLAEAAKKARNPRRNVLLARPDGKHHGPVAGGVRPYPGFHTSWDRDVAAPYAQMKGVDEVDRADDCEECDDPPCPACVEAWSIPDYPVVIGVDMQGLEPLPDYDAIHLSMDALRITAREALEHEDPIQWLQSLPSLDREELPDSTMGILFERFASSVADPGPSLAGVLEDLTEEEALRQLRVVAEGQKPEVEQIAMRVVGQFRYTQDVADGRVVSVALMRPFWPEGLVRDDDELADSIADAGWDPITTDAADTFSPDFNVVWSREPADNSRVEYHGTSWRNLLLAMPWLKDEIRQPPKPFRPETIANPPRKLRLLSIDRSQSRGKKYRALFQDESTGRTRTVHFGATGYEDYTTHRDPERKARYLTRHGRGREDWSNPTTPGSLSRWILWNKPTLEESVRDFKRRFGL